MEQSFNNKIENQTTYLWYQYSKSCAVQNFSLNKYKNMKVENTIYVYDEKGILLGIINAPTEKQCIKEVKRYIIKKIFLNLIYGGTDKNFSQKDKMKIRDTEWDNLIEFVKSKFTKK